MALKYRKFHGPQKKSSGNCNKGEQSGFSFKNVFRLLCIYLGGAAFCGIIMSIGLNITQQKSSKIESESVTAREVSQEQGKSNSSSVSAKGKSEPGDAEAQFELGFRYATGEGVARDWTEAVKWYRKAAEQGHTGAQLLLGVCYVNGSGVAEDMTEGIKWIRKAARQGNDKAQVFLKQANLDW